METIPFEHAMILWTPKMFEGTGGLARDKPGIEIVWWPSDRPAPPYAFSDGACCGYWRNRTKNDRRRLAASVFIAVVVRDGVSAPLAHAEFMKISEYRDLLPLDMLNDLKDGENDE